MLNAAVALKLLSRDGDWYRTTPAADAFLVPGRLAYIGDALRYSVDLYPEWAKLPKLVQSGRPTLAPHAILGQDPEKTRNFILGMHNRALGMTAAIPHGIDLSGRRQLLDVGGGPGTYSILLVQATPGLRSVILDLPGVLEVTKEIVESSSCSDRISLMPGDYLETAFKTGNDVVLLSGMMHRETPSNCRRLLRKAFGALTPGGLVIVSDVFFDDEGKDTPLFATHFALNMMLTSDHGSAHAKTEMAAWITAAGFAETSVKDLPPLNPHTLLFGTKPRETP